jgi:capsid portal protein
VTDSSAPRTGSRGGKAEVTVRVLGTAGGPIIAANTREIEDEFSPFYGSSLEASGQVLRPPYEPRVLERLTQENNVLGACIEAMVVNADGTGHSIEKENKDPDRDADERDDPVALRLAAFFNEPFPGQSFITMRRDLRRDLERLGYGFLEVMRNLEGEIVFLRSTPARTFRIVRLDAPIAATRTVMRNGVAASYEVMLRERRFCQVMGGKLLFFKEFGASRELDKQTGRWATADSPVAAPDRATELIYFQVGQDPDSPYGVPRWEGQIPSVIGSRAAEEANIAYLQSGGLPPALLIVQGGSMARDARQALEQQFAPGQKQRVAIIEVPSSEGTLDRAGAVSVTVERFGHERSGDAMFEKYDDKCFERVLRAFRFSPMFLGKSADFNFATAYASCLAAEAQVFGPERAHFDEIVTRKLLPALGGAGYVFRSKPLQLTDVSQQIAALGLAARLPGVEPQSLIDAVNRVAGLDVEFSRAGADGAGNLDKAVTQ